MAEIISDLKELQLHLNTYHNELERCRETLKFKSSQYEASKVQAESLKRENAKLQEIICSRHRTHQDQMDLKALLQKADDEKRQCIDQINNITQEAARKQEEYLRKTATLEDTIQTQNRQLATLNVELMQCREEISTLEVEKEDIERILKKERCDRSVLTQQRSNDSESSQILKSRLVKMKEELARAQREIQLLKKKT